MLSSTIVESNLRKFPTKKYVTYYCSMLQRNEIPCDIIKIILSMMIKTDEIPLRIIIIEIISSIFTINIENIRLPKNIDITYEEIHEIMILKMFYIAVSNIRGKSFKNTH